MKSPGKNAKAAKVAPTKPPLSRGRLWLFRVTALLLPVILLGVVELALRVAGYGYSTGFFKRTELDGQPHLINNDTFTLRFFPPELARWPGTFKMPVTKPSDTTRIFIFGESAAMGDPQPAYGASRYLEVLLRHRFPGRKFEVINTSITAINSHVILPIARDCAQADGDLWIIYMGNNEMVGPFGAATVFGSQAPPLTAVRMNLAIQRTRVGQLAMTAMRKLAGQSVNTSWGGMRMFLQNQIPPNDPRRETVYQNFEANLRDIVHAGLNSGAKVILNTMSVNLRDCPPFASLTNTNLPAADRAQFEKLYAEARQLAAAGNPANAAERFAQAAAIDSSYAELHYRWAEALLSSSNATAGAHYQLACDTDALPFRTDTRVNAAIRRVAEQFAGPQLVLSDAEAALTAASPFGLAGREMFFEHVHFSFRGNYELGRLWAEHVASLISPQSESSAQAWASQEECERDLGLTPWNRGFVIESVIRRMQGPPLSSQFNNSNRLAALQTELTALRAFQADTNNLMRCGQELVNAIQRAPQDSFVYESFANFLEAVGDRKQALEAYRKMVALLPHDYYGKLQTGRLLGELGQPAEGEPLLLAAAQQRPAIPDTWVELGNLCMMQQKFSDALKHYERAQKLRPNDASHACYVATALARLNRRAEAATGFRRALQLRPDFWEAHFELAGVLAAENQVAESLREYAEAIRLNPRHAVSRVNFGVMLVRQNRLDDALAQFQTALQIDPQNKAAQDYLQQVTARRDQRK